MSTLREDIEAGLALLPTIRKTDSARVQLYATGRQENPTRSPRQVIKVGGKLVAAGPAASDYQFEPGGGIYGVLNFRTTRELAIGVCRARGVPPTTAGVFQAVQTDPVLAAAFARLLYFTDPYALPVVGDEDGAWALYLRTWRPGAYKRQPNELRAKWRKSYAEALKAYELG